MKRTGLPFLVCTAVSIVAGFTAAPAIAATCESLKLLSLPDVTISAAQTIPAGNYAAANGQTLRKPANLLPGGGNRNTDEPVQHQFRGVAAAAATWNGVFRGEGSGGSAGAITFALMANAIQRNYATMSNDNGHSATPAPPPPHGSRPRNQPPCGMATSAQPAVASQPMGTSAYRPPDDSITPIYLKQPRPYPTASVV